MLRDTYTLLLTAQKCLLQRIQLQPRGLLPIEGLSPSKFLVMGRDYERYPFERLRQSLYLWHGFYRNSRVASRHFVVKVL